MLQSKPRFWWSILVLIGIATITTPAATQTTEKSINSTSQNRFAPPDTSVPEQPIILNNNYSVFAINDLGMHCGDLDARVASILPLFNVLHAQIIRQGREPKILTEESGFTLYYSAASNPDDPALSRPPLLSPNGSLFKSNFWDAVFQGAFDPFYPPAVTPLAPLVPLDRGLPVPDLAELYPPGGGAGILVADQQDMPGIFDPYVVNEPQGFARFDTDLPFFVNFPFGYRLTHMNWYAADGIPVSTIDDQGRLNSYPLMRVEARSPGNTTVATIDTVVPISGEADCKICHAALEDGGDGSAIKGIDAVTAFDDPRYSEVPTDVSIEWATDINLLRMHDKNEGTQLAPDLATQIDPNTGLADNPVVCQTCHYTPALDLANVGPLGGSDLFPDPDANGREQRIHATMSRVIHDYHDQFIDAVMPPPDADIRTGPDGNPVINQFVLDTLEQTCYGCHPGKVTQCLRGAMFNGGMVCQDCHGGMAQVGNDFSANMSLDTPFPLGADLTKRVPWANEPGCQSCHTGDAINNLTNDANVVVSNDGIRLLQAYLKGDNDATPIIASNRRFAENDIVSTSGTTVQVLYRLSKGHEGVFCEACHGSTHAEWPNANPFANDNVTAQQLQGHTGSIIECGSCHQGIMDESLDGPHGLHPVGNDGNSAHWSNRHEDFIEHHGGERSSNVRQQCGTCHGTEGEGTVLAKVAVDRSFVIEECENGSLCPTGEVKNFTVTLNKGELVDCGLCHSNPLSRTGGHH